MVLIKDVREFVSVSILSVILQLL